jgi:hypothetical protein
MTYQTEFPDFSPSTLPAIPEGWTDTSWHNDACPSFNTGKGVIVFIDFEDPADRESEGSEHRFHIMADPEVADHNEDLFASNDWDAILHFVAQKA